MARSWLAAAQAAFASYAPVSTRTDMTPNDTAVSVLVEAMLHTELGSSELNPEDCPNCGGELTEVEYNDEEEGFTHD